ncbi:MAG: hypothetical protein IID42_14180 [Planctomycetes bacterium]|nr:hypothetical protein [Planctomycetota bacterium]
MLRQRGFLHRRFAVAYVSLVATSIRFRQMRFDGLVAVDDEQPMLMRP